MTEKPLPCPLCGEKPIVERGLGGVDWVIMHDSNPAVFAPSHTVCVYDTTRAKAVREWNRRAK